MQAVCFPVGFSGSADQPLAYVLTAHPNIVMSNRCDLSESWWNNGAPLPTATFLSEILEMNRKMNMQKINYTKENRYYAISGQWQGHFERLTVVGDCSPDTNTRILVKKNCEALEIFANDVDLPLKFIFVVRNPYDMISSKTISAYWKKTRTEILSTMIHRFIDSCKLRETLLARVATMPKLQVFIWHLEEHIANPQQKLKELCRFLGVESSESYLNACAKIFYKKPSKSRYLIDWPNQYKTRIAETVNRYDFLSCYSWDS